MVYLWFGQEQTCISGEKYWGSPSPTKKKPRQKRGYRDEPFGMCSLIVK